MPGKRFLSCEPLVGPLVIDKFFWSEPRPHYFKNGELAGTICSSEIDWVIVGGESGNTTKQPMISTWAQSLRHQCKYSLVPFFFKQWGQYVEFDQMPKELQLAIKRGETKHKMFNYEDGGLIHTIHSVGKHAAGSLLDGVEHKNFPL